MNRVDYLSTIAQIESGGNPNAKNPRSSAGGLYQFIDSTWASYGGGGNRYNVADATRAVNRLTDDNAAYLTRVLGREPTGGELYLAHQQGMGGAAKLLRNPNANAAATVGAQQVALNGGNSSMTNAEFAGLWTGKFDRVASSKGYASSGPLEAGVDADTGILTVDVPTAGASTPQAGSGGASEFARGSQARATGDYLAPAVTGAAALASSTALSIADADRSTLFDSFKDYFGRFVIILLGLVFVGGGVAMFVFNKTPAELTNVARKVATRGA